MPMYTHKHTHIHQSVHICRINKYKTNLRSHISTLPMFIKFGLEKLWLYFHFHVENSVQSIFCGFKDIFCRKFTNKRCDILMILHICFLETHCPFKVVVCFTVVSWGLVYTWGYCLSFLSDRNIVIISAFIKLNLTSFECLDIFNYVANYWST